jgi:hypothetical protein
MSAGVVTAEQAAAFRKVPILATWLQLCALCASVLFPCHARSAVAVLLAHGFPGAVRFSMLSRNNVLEVAREM